MNPEDITTRIEQELEAESVAERVDAACEEFYSEGDEYDPGDLKENQDFAQDDMQEPYEADFGETADIDFDVEY